MGAPKGKGKDKDKGKEGKGKGKSVDVKGKGKGKGKASDGKGKSSWVEVKPTVLVTGASGFVAMNVVRRLLSQNYKVRGTVRSLADEAKVGPLKQLFPKLELFEADLLGGEEAFAKAVEGCKYVMHCASPFKLNVGVDDIQKDLIDPAVKGTEAVMKAAAKANVSKVVITSSVAAVGPPSAWFKDPSKADETKVFDESDWNLEDKPVDSVTGYRVSKVKAEQRAWELSKELGLTTVSICPSFVIGPMLGSRPDGESVSFIMAMLDGSLKEKGDKGELKGGRKCVVDVRDVSQAHVLAMESDATDGKRINVTSECSYSTAELADMLKDRFKAYPLPTSSQESSYAPKHNVSRAKELVGFEPKPVQISLRDMAAAAIRLELVARKISLKPVKFGKVSGIAPDSKGVDLLVKVESIGEAEEGKLGEKFVEVFVGDNTGLVTLRLTAEEASVAEVGKVIEVRNAAVKMWKGFIQLSVGKWGKISKHEGGTELEVNKDKNVSATEYELVMA